MPAEVIEHVEEPLVKKEKKKKSKKQVEDDDTVMNPPSDSEKKDKKKKKRKEREEEGSPEKKKSKKVKEDKEESMETDQVPEETGEFVQVEEDTELDELAVARFNLSESTVASLLHRGIEKLFPIQAASFQHIMDGKDLVGRARTGTGKTLAFALPMVERLKKEAAVDPSIFKKRGRAPRILVMAPTRELASQVAKEFDSVLSNGLKTVCIYGGTPYDPQYAAFRDGVDIVVGTPGRLIDHVERGSLKLDQLMFVCMDEADQMLDIGFADNMDLILKQTHEQKKAKKEANQSCPDLQTLLFSATMPEWIKEAIRKYMRPDNKITVDLIGNQRLKTSESVKHFAIPSHWQNRAQILGDIVTVYGRGKNGRTIIFVETKGEANELVLNEKLKDSQVIHGDIVQKQRETSMQGFREGRFRCLITTNVCARGVDIPEVDLVINCEPPGDVETYIHRSGRTGRAGKSGVCVTFYKPQQEYMVSNITRRAGVQFTRIGAPQPADLIKAHAADAVETLQQVQPKAMSYFTSTAKEVLEKFEGNAQKAVEACLAMLCNTTAPMAPRSLLSAAEGWQTLHFKSDRPFRNPGYIRSIVQRCFPNVGYEDTRGWRMTADEMGVVVDFKAEKVDISQDENGNDIVSIDGIQWYDDKGVSMEVASEMPELMDLGVKDNGRGNGRMGGRGNQQGGQNYGGRFRQAGNNSRGNQGSGQRRSFGGQGPRNGSRGSSWK